MSRYSGAYSKLIARLDEVDAITRLASDIANSRRAAPPYSTRVRALCRSGVVLLCSHVEGYVEELASLAIIRIGEGDVPKTAMSLGFRYFLSRDLIQGIRRTEDADAIGSKIVDFLNRDTHIWDSSIDFSPPLSADTFIGSFASPRHENIRRFFGRFGFEGFQHELALKLRADLTLCPNPPPKLAMRLSFVAKLVIFDNSFFHPAGEEKAPSSGLNQILDQIVGSV